MKTISIFCCLLYAMWTEGADINVEGYEGDEVVFKCSHILAWKNHKYLCKDPCKSNSDILVTVQPGRRAESGRITMVDPGNGVVTVTFSQLQLSDLGKYWCGVDRPGFDTFNEVHLTVKKAVASETTVILEVSTTSTYQIISTTTQLQLQPPGIDTSRPTNLSAASNYTNGGQQNISTGAVLFATVGGFSMITILVLLACHRKCRGNFKSQPQVRFSGSDLDNTDEREQAGCDYGNIGEEVQPEKLSERFSNTHRLKQDLPTCASAAAECSVPFHIYENICCSRGAEDYKQSAANVQDDHDSTSGIYVNPLPFTVSQTSGDDCLRKHTNEPTETRKNNHTSKASAHHSRARSDSKKVRPRSLWFGLDISGV